MTQMPDKEGLIPPDWVLLDTCSTDNVVHDDSLIINTRKCFKYEEMKIHTNGGSFNYNTIGMFKYLPVTCYHNVRSIANVLSLKSVSDVPGCSIHMDTHIGPEIYINYGNSVLKFNQSTNGLYYCRIHDLRSFYEGTNSHQSAISLVSLIHNKYSKVDTMRVKSARNLQKAMMWPLSTMMKRLIKNGIITYTNINEGDFDIADEIFGRAPEQVKGKMTAPPKKRIPPHKYFCMTSKLK